MIGNDHVLHPGGDRPDKDQQRWHLAGRPTSRTTPRRLRRQGRRRTGTAGRLDLLGAAFTSARVRQVRQDHHPLPRPDPQHPRPRREQRTVRGHQHPHPPAHPTGLRLPQPRGADRHGHPHPRRPLPTPARTIIKPPTETAVGPPDGCDVCDTLIHSVELSVPSVLRCQRKVIQSRTATEAGGDRAGMAHGSWCRPSSSPVDRVT